MKRTLALSAAAALTLGLAACSTDTKNDAAPKGEQLNCTLQQADFKQQIEVAGEKGVQPTVTADLSEVQLDAYKLVNVEKGDGNKVVAGPEAIYKMLVTVTDPQGQVLASEPLETTLDASSGLVDWIINAAACTTDNGRVVAAGPASVVLPGAAENSGGQFTADTPLITVIDMQGVSQKLTEDQILKHAEGKEVPAPEGFPTVEFDEKTGPKITIPEGAKAPDKLQIANLIEGTGETVADGANVYVHYRGVIWRTGEEFDASWTRGSHIDFKTNQVVPGFAEALVGQKVGSRVIALVDPASGYGAEQLQQMGHQGDDVMVFVIDILGTENPAQ
ncbi:FKBP-type peptidyl-prolyl cis-trans isomerase [Leucobacter sp. OH2974_COT-288]|uniref:peptidylprolyl isomerase n=1 Tax=Canibacter oris TaxID=1365628 RepID=A0A840DPV9_9MICO|nr:FKBP-type peptidyl-prolyl cis-trans isomerase [Canibacter oris]MBB4072147.1 peptidylprolyl isomerase [Canibacter oris]RRD36624.1 FKBP-type peptidyl-prolyl cis-trans isomerase [Leucobacter sp. OH2974_COT-288]